MWAVLIGGYRTTMIERLQISYLRNLTQVNLSPAACNVIIGANGGGKPLCWKRYSYYLEVRAFRHHQPKRYIQHHQDTVTVYARLNDGSTLAIQNKPTPARFTLESNHRL